MPNKNNTSLSISNVIRVKTLDIFRSTNQLRVYKKYLKNQFEYTREEIDQYQEEKFREILLFHYNKNPTYRKFVEDHGFKMNKTIRIHDVPVISKDFFRNNKNSHSLPGETVKTKHSSGTTGNPLTYHLSKESLGGQWPSFWRALQVYNVQPCDKTMMIAGHSLFNNRSLKRKIYDYINNFIVVPAFDLTDEVLEEAYQIMVKKKVKVVYAYTSAVLLFLQFLQRRGYKLNLKAIFTTAELFIPSVRSLAKEYCQCDVIDTYGANDGGVQAFECRHHTGYHLNFERCMVEVINGELVLTDLLNKAMPFIRYRVGDCTSGKHIIKDKCECGRSLFRIPDISGRINEYIKDVDANIVHTAFFNQLFAADQHIIQFQIIQNVNKLYINIIHDNMQKKEDYLTKYAHLVEKRIKMPSEFIFNMPIKKLDNMKVPVFWKNK